MRLPRLLLQGTNAGEVVQTAGAAPGAEGHLRIHDHITQLTGTYRGTGQEKSFLTNGEAIPMDTYK